MKKAFFQKRAGNFKRSNKREIIISYDCSNLKKDNRSKTAQ